MKPCVNCFEVKRGGLTIQVICMNVDKQSFKRLVTSGVCDVCSDKGESSKTPTPGTPPERPQEPHMGTPRISPLGTLNYQRTNWEPPPTPPGYHRRSSDPTSDDAWILDPIDEVCKHLELVPAEIGSCGYQRVARRCSVIDSFVGSKTCKTCVKKVTNAG